MFYQCPNLELSRSWVFLSFYYLSHVLVNIIISILLSFPKATILIHILSSNMSKKNCFTSPCVPHQRREILPNSPLLLNHPSNILSGNTARLFRLHLWWVAFKCFVRGGFDNWNLRQGRRKSESEIRRGSRC